MYESGKILMDPLHGGIKLSHTEVASINHPLMQRLRHIAQNDVLEMTFPGATHTRFAHSIGAMHVTGLLFDAASSNAITKYRREERRLTRVEEKALAYLRTCVRLATLFHDTGHGPFSHQSERAPALSSVLNWDGAFDKLWEGVEDVDTFYPEKPESLHHEHYSARMAYQILSDISLPHKDMKQDVMSMLESTTVSPSSTFTENCWFISSAIGPRDIIKGGDAETRNAEADEAITTLWMAVLGSLVSGVMDGDRIDYLLRDTLFTGATYGHFQLDHLCNTLSFHEDTDENWFGLAIRDHGSGALEDFLHARMRMYRQVYQHKTARGSFGLILHRAIAEVMQDEAFASKIKRAAQSTTRFIQFTDEAFWSAFTDYALDNPGSDCERLVQRKGYEHIATYEDLTPAQLKDRVSKHAKARGEESSDYVVMRDAFRFAPRKGSEKSDRIRILSGKPTEEGSYTSRLEDVLPMYRTFEAGIDIMTILHAPEAIMEEKVEVKFTCTCAG